MHKNCLYKYVIIVWMSLFGFIVLMLSNSELDLLSGKKSHNFGPKTGQNRVLVSNKSINDKSCSKGSDGPATLDNITGYIHTDQLTDL